MSNTDILGNKPLPHYSKPEESSGIVIATVTACLASHDQCMGHYIDFSHKYRIICHCFCHRKIDKFEKVTAQWHNKNVNKASSPSTETPEIKEMFANNNSTKEPKKGAGSKAVEKLEDRQVYCTTGKKSGRESLETMTIKPLEMGCHLSEGEKRMFSR